MDDCLLCAGDPDAARVPGNRERYALRAFDYDRRAAPRLWAAGAYTLVAWLERAYARNSHENHTGADPFAGVRSEAVSERTMRTDEKSVGSGEVEWCRAVSSGVEWCRGVCLFVSSGVQCTRPLT